jgi:hypothetical protein
MEIDEGYQNSKFELQTRKGARSRSEIRAQEREFSVALRAWACEEPNGWGGRARAGEGLKYCLCVLPLGCEALR